MIHTLWPRKAICSQSIHPSIHPSVDPSVHLSIYSTTYVVIFHKYIKQYYIPDDVIVTGEMIWVKKKSIFTLKETTPWSRNKYSSNNPTQTQQEQCKLGTHTNVHQTVSHRTGLSDSGLASWWCTIFSLDLYAPIPASYVFQPTSSPVPVYWKDTKSAPYSTGPCTDLSSLLNLPWLWCWASAWFLSNSPSPSWAWGVREKGACLEMWCYGRAVTSL